MAGFFDNAWWRDANTNRDSNNPLWKQAGTVAKGFGGHLANKLMPFQMGEEGMEPRKGYNPLNLVQLGLMGMSPESQFTYDKKGNEYRAGFGDWMSNVTNMGQRRMMEQQKMMDYLIDKPLSRKLMKAQIGEKERAAKTPIKPWIQERKVGDKIKTTETSFAWDKDKKTYVPNIRESEAARWEPKEKTFGKIIGKRKEENPDGTFDQVFTYYGKDEAIKESRVPHTSHMQFLQVGDSLMGVDKSLVVPKPQLQSSQGRQNTVNNPMETGQSVQEFNNDFPNLVQEPVVSDPQHPYVIAQIPKPPSQETQIARREKWSTSISDKKVFIQKSQQWLGKMQPTQGNDGVTRMQWTGDGDYDKLIKLAKNSSLTGMKGGFKGFGTAILDAFSIPQGMSERKQLEQLANLIKLRATTLALPANIALTSKMLDSQAEKKYLSEISAPDIVNNWFKSPAILRANVERLKRIERVETEMKMNQLRTAQSEIKTIPWMQKHLQDPNDREFWIGRGGLSNYDYKSSFGN